MARIAEYKSFTENKPIQTLPAPNIVYIPLSQHTGKPCELLDVKPQDHVTLGQQLATASNQPYAPIHASVSGKVLEITSWPHPILGKAKAIVIENDGKNSVQRTADSGQTNKLTPQQIRDIVFQAGVVGLGGAAFPTHIKLNPPKPIKTLLINIAECEPFLTADSRLTIEKAGEILLGIELASRCLAAQETLIAIEDNKPLAIKTLKETLKAAGNNMDPAPKLIVLKSHYPQGGEKQLIKTILNKELPAGKLPFELGVNIQNVSTIYAIYEAVFKHKPLYERVVTVSGNCLSDPKNLLVRIGTPIKELIAACGPLKQIPAKIIAGGPMMGIAQYTDNAPVIKSTTGIILLDQRSASVLEEKPCIRCGNCIRECSMGLMPCLLNASSEKALWQQAKDLGVLNCLECGLCSFVCPAHRKIVQSIKKAKAQVIK